MATHSDGVGDRIAAVAEVKQRFVPAESVLNVTVSPDVNVTSSGSASRYPGEEVIVTV
jgi:hypothetical protein